MSTPHKHAALIKQWADGAVIEWYDPRTSTWQLTKGCWHEYSSYRVRPEPKLSATGARLIEQYVSSADNSLSDTDAVLVGCKRRLVAYVLDLEQIVKESHIKLRANHDAKPPSNQDTVVSSNQATKP